MSTTINTIGAELNFVQINKNTALYTSSTLEEGKYQSLIFKTELKNEEWIKGKYYHLGKSYAYGNISYPGENYYFYFAGSWEIGKLECTSDKLTETYGHRWFTFVNGNYGRQMRYPVSIYNIRKTQPKQEKDV